MTLKGQVACYLKEHMSNKINFKYNPITFYNNDKIDVRQKKVKSRVAALLKKSKTYGKGLCNQKVFEYNSVYPTLT